MDIQIVGSIRTRCWASDVPIEACVHWSEKGEEWKVGIEFVWTESYCDTRRIANVLFPSRYKANCRTTTCKRWSLYCGANQSQYASTDIDWNTIQCMEFILSISLIIGGTERWCSNHPHGDYYHPSINISIFSIFSIIIIIIIQQQRQRQRKGRSGTIKESVHGTNIQRFTKLQRRHNIKFQRQVVIRSTTILQFEVIINVL